MSVYNEWQGGTGSQPWSTVTNWTLGTAPASAEYLTLDNAASNIDSGFGQMGVTLTSWEIGDTFTGSIGTTQAATKAVSGITRSSTDATATSTTHGYIVGNVIEMRGAVEAEYNGTFIITAKDANTFTYTVGGTPTTPAASSSKTVCLSDALSISATTWVIGTPSISSTAGSGSSLLKINFGAVQFTGTVLSTPDASSESGLPPVQIRGTHAANVLTVQGGRVGVAVGRSGDVSTLATLNVSGNTANVNLGDGVTWTTINQVAGTTTIGSGGTTINLDGGTLNTDPGDYAITTVNLRGTMVAKHRKSAAASIGTLYGLAGGTLDISSGGAFTITDFYFDPGFSVIQNSASPNLVVTNWHPRNVRNWSWDR